MIGGELLKRLLAFLEISIKDCPDPRNGSNTQYSMRDFFFSTFAVFFSQSPSFLAHQTLMEKEGGSSNARGLFGIQLIPTDNQVRGILDSVPPGLLRPTFGSTFDLLNQQGIVLSICIQQQSFNSLHIFPELRANDYPFYQI